MKKTQSLSLLVLGMLLILPGLASAHILPGDPWGCDDGFVHPFTGLNHLLAMIAVGLWAAQYRGTSPLGFRSRLSL